MTTETEVLKFRLPKPVTDVGMAFLDHQNSKVPIINDSKGGGFEKDSEVPNRKRLIIKIRIPNPKAKTETTTVPLKNNHQDSKPITKTSGYRERVRKQLQETFSRVSSETDESISPAINPVQVAVSVESAMFERIGWSNPIKKANYQSILFNLKDPKNPDLRRKVLLGEIKPETLVTMSAEEMASHKRQSENIQIQLKSLKRCLHDADEEEKATTDMFQCSRCRERKCTYYQMQTRSADEPMTTYVTCCKCSKRWKV
ncbi:transcription elongation factor TFIIS [Quercus suber]|uniref:transcription elongation factor TFIIS n=1 Tax=Quercus suber TaxID=58331 RepID=UPI000CE23F05|nr:transcription elongation factor TFIIS-like [Quercus suber]POE83513.1 transcription elongation factor tfiis [Quercus suber]